MKHYSYLLALAMATVAFTACEDVPEPYRINTTKTNTDVLLSESFSSSLGKFQSKAASGDLEWIIDYSSAVITGYKDFDGDGKKENKAGVTYLVGPAIDLADVTAAYVSISQAINYEKSTIKDDHKLLASEDYTNDVNAATWTELPLLFDGVGGSFTFVDQQVQIPESLMGKKINLALKHTAYASYSSTWEVKNFKVQKGQASSGGGGGDTPSPQPTETKTLPYEETFATSLGSFFNQTTSGSGEWIIDFKTAKATGYNSTTKVTTAGTYFLISSPIDLTSVSSAHVAYEYILRYNKGDENQQTLISSDYESDATKATWTVLKKKHTEGSDWNTFANYDITVPATFLGKTVHIAFVYNTNASSGSTWEVKNFSIKAGEGSEAADGSTYGSNEPPTPTPSDDAINETFANSLGVFSNVSVTGTFEWHVDYSCAQITSYVNPTNNEAEAYLISTPITLASEAYHISFEYILRYALDSSIKDNHQVLVTSNYTGNPATTTWTALDFNPTQGSDWKTWYKADLNVPSIMEGKEVVVALRYVGTTEKAGTWEVRNFVLTKGSVDGGDTPTPDPTPGGEGTSLADFTNGDFETWADGIPTGWQSTTSASMSGVLSQSTDAHGGSYSVKLVGNDSGNKRLAYKELTLEAGEYTLTFYVKGTSDGCSIRPGYVPVTDGKVGSYVYGDYTNDIPASGWTKVTHTFSLTSTTTVNLVVMNPGSKNKPGHDILIDDYTIVKN